MHMVRFIATRPDEEAFEQSLDSVIAFSRAIRLNCRYFQIASRFYCRTLKGFTEIRCPAAKLALRVLAPSLTPQASVET